MFRRRNVLAAAVGMLVLLLSPLSIPAPAAADAAVMSCHIVCDGVDPSTAVYEDSNGVLRKCAGIRTVFRIEAGQGHGWVELRYSTTCRMAWARGGLHGIKVEGFNANGSLRVVYDYYSTAQTGYTRAVDDAGLTARACVITPSSGGAWTCTAKY